MQVRGYVCAEDKWLSVIALFPPEVGARKQRPNNLLSAQMSILIILPITLFEYFRIQVRRTVLKSRNERTARP